MIENLKKVLQQEDTVVFVGSGISLWSGLPSWSGLIRELATFVESKGHDSNHILKEMEQGSLLLAASYGFDKLTKPQIAQFIRTACRIGTAKPHDIHHKLITLGPTCFVTTNYDKLLELSFQKWLPDKWFRTVLNTQLTETVDITQSRAADFLFKLHGDAEHSDSVILTQEQYRSMNQNGELYHALDAIKTLMSSRPFVYVGFGLKDPAFLHIKDLIINTYKGATREHYAIMADISDGERDYWIRNYGIHLVSYATTVTDNKRDHSPLLSLLDELKRTQSGVIQPANSINPAFILNLARYAAKLSNYEPPATQIPLFAHLVEKNDRYFEHTENAQSIESLLDQGPHQFILTGSSGSGKSHALKNSVVRLATRLGKHCLEETFPVSSVLIPVIADLKLYKGSIWALLEQTLPVGIPLEFLLTHFKVKIFLDAFNEIPREYLESNEWQADLSRFLTSIRQASLVISSRSTDGLEQLAFPVFNVHQIDKKFIANQLAQSNIVLNEVFEYEYYNILQRPFFYKLIFEGHVNIDGKTNPQKIYASFLNSLNTRFQEKFATQLALEPLLSLVAMEAIDAGYEAFGIDVLSKQLQVELEAGRITSFLPIEIINWLVSQDFLVALPGQRISFFHQSITEYLAASRLARMFIADPGIVKEKLQYRRWDQALLLTLGFLNKTKAERFLKTVIKIDFHLALTAVKYVEGNSKDKLVEQFLIEIFRHEERGHAYFPTIKSNLQLTRYHIPALKKMVQQGGKAGGVAFSLLIDPLGEDVKQEGFDLLIENLHDDEFCSHATIGLKIGITPTDLSTLIKLSDQVQHTFLTEQGNIDNYKGFISGVANLLRAFEPDLVFTSFYNPDKPVKVQQIKLAIVRTFLTNNHSARGLELAFTLLKTGYEEAFSIISAYCMYTNPQILLEVPEHLDSYISILTDFFENASTKNTVRAVIYLFRNLCLHKKDLIPHFLQKAENSAGVIKICYLYCVAVDDDYSLLFRELEELVNMDDHLLMKEPLYYLGQLIDIKWKGYESLLVKVLKEGNEILSDYLCFPLSFNYFLRKPEYLILDIGPIDWWLNKLVAISKQKNSMFVYVVYNAVKYITKEKKNEFLAEFNNPASPYRQVIARYILPQLPDLTLEDLSEESLALILDPKSFHRLYLYETILTNIATETFVINRLLPLTKKAKGKHLQSLKNILDQVGHKMGRRYL